MFRDRLIYRLFLILLIFSVISVLSIYAVTHNDIEKIKMGAGIMTVEKQMLNDFISISFYLFFLSFLLSLFLSQKILLPVKELYRGALAIRDGNIISIPDVPTYDELKEVIRAFNDMSGALKEKTDELERTNIEIRKARDFLETVMDSIMDEIAIIDRDMRVVKANRAAMIKYSGDLSDIRNEECYRVFHRRGDTCEIDDCPAKKVFENGETYRTVHTHINEAGEKSYCEIIASPVFDRNGNVIYMIEVLRDITERMRYDEELKRKNKELMALNSISELLSRSMTDRSTIREAVFRLVDMLGMDDGGIFLIDERTNELNCYFTDRKIPFGNNLPSEVIKTGVIHVSTDVSANNSSIPYWLSGIGIRACCCIPLKGQDRIVGALYLFSTEPHEFTEEEKTILRSAGDMIGVAMEGIKLYDELKNLRVTEKGLAEMVFNSISEGLYTIDTSYIITSVNKAAEEILGLKAKDLIGKRCMDIIRHRAIDSDELLCDTDCPALKAFNKRSITREADFITPDGKRLSLRLSCSPLIDSRNNVIGAVEVFTDVTKEREIDRMKTEFVKTVSHEFRTPLSAIVGMTEMLYEDEVTGDRAKEYLETIMREGERLSAMVTELLDISRLESGEWIMNKTEIDFNLLLHEIRKTLSSIIERKKIQLETCIGNDVKCFKGDREKLKQLLINLITNSINYSDEGCMIDINIRRDGERLLMDISDSGWGIPQDDIPHLTKKFYRGRHGIRTKGTGLGLALCKEIARLHGGDISIKSRLGRGTTVTVDIPFEVDCNE